MITTLGQQQLANTNTPKDGKVTDNKMNGFGSKSNTSFLFGSPSQNTSCSNSLICAKCNTQLSIDERVACNGACGKHFHYSCAQMSKDAAQHLISVKGMKWICTDCGFIPAINSIFDKLNDIHSDVKKCIQQQPPLSMNIPNSMLQSNETEIDNKIDEKTVEDKEQKETFGGIDLGDPLSTNASSSKSHINLGDKFNFKFNKASELTKCASFAFGSEVTSTTPTPSAPFWFGNLKADSTSSTSSNEPAKDEGKDSIKTSIANR